MGALAGAAAVTVGVIAGYLLIGIATAVLILVVWLLAALPTRRLVPSGPGGDGPAPPGGAGVREPLRPLPHAPAGAAAREIEDEDGRAVASL